MGWESFGVVRFDLGPFVQGQMRIAKLKSAYNLVLLVLEVWDGKPTYRKSWTGNLQVWSDLTLGPRSKSNEDVKPNYRKSWPDVVRFNPWPLL